MNKLEFKPLTLLAGALGIAAWYIARLQQKADIAEAVDDYMEDFLQAPEQSSENEQ